MSNVIKINSKNPTTKVTQDVSVGADVPEEIREDDIYKELSKKIKESQRRMYRMRLMASKIKDKLTKM